MHKRAKEIKESGLAQGSIKLAAVQEKAKSLKLSARGTEVGRISSKDLHENPQFLRGISKIAVWGEAGQTKCKVRDSHRRATVERGRKRPWEPSPRDCSLKIRLG